MKTLLKMNSFRFKGLAIVVGITIGMGTLGVFGCGKDAPEQAATNNSAKAAKKVIKADEAVPENKPEDPPKAIYSYNPVGKRDPFEVFIAVDPLKPDNVPLQPLQQFTIDQLKLVGIIWGISSPKAMVEDPRGKGHVIKKGSLIGRNWGKVIRIKQDEVIVAEEFRDLDGKIIVNEISLKLPEPEPIEQ